MSAGVVGESGYCEAHRHVVVCFLVPWCMSVSLGTYLAAVVCDGLIFALWLSLCIVG